MFNFQTTTYINSKKYIDGTPRWCYGTTNNTTVTNSDDTTITDGNKQRTQYFKVNHNTVKLTNTAVTAGSNKIYKKTGCVGKSDSVTISSVATTYTDSSKLYRLNLYIGLSMADQDSYYANDLVFKGHPFSIEFAGGTSAANLKKLIENYELLTIEKPVVKVTTASSGADLVLTATNAYQRFKKVTIEEYTEDNASIYGWTGGWTVNSDLTSSVVKGHEEFGTYYQLTKDNYLPTYEHRRFDANQNDEEPIPGALYNQYLVDICVDRGIMGGDAVGEKVTSKTTHVFWVNSTVADAFEDDIKAGTGVSIVEVDAHGTADTVGASNTAGIKDSGITSNTARSTSSTAETE